MADAMDALSVIRIDPSGPVPVYYQVYEGLRAQLGTTRLPVGRRIPTERAIAESLQVSRQTVRQALSRLEREGLVFRRQGDGTYVSEPRVETDLSSINGFTSSLSARGLRVRSVVLDMRLVIPPPNVAEELGVDGAVTSAVMLRRLRLLDGVPAELETVWLVADRCAPLLELNMNDRSLYATLRDLIGIQPTRATERLTATVLDEFEAHELKQPAGEAVFLIERVTRDADGQPFESVKALMRADRFFFRAELDLAEPSANMVQTATREVVPLTAPRIPDPVSAVPIEDT